MVFAAWWMYDVISTWSRPTGLGVGGQEEQNGVSRPDLDPPGTAYRKRTRAMGMTMRNSLEEGWAGCKFIPAGQCTMAIFANDAGA